MVLLVSEFKLGAAAEVSPSLLTAVADNIVVSASAICFCLRWAMRRVYGWMGRKPDRPKHAANTTAIIIQILNVTSNICNLN